MPPAAGWRPGRRTSWRFTVASGGDDDDDGWSEMNEREMFFSYEWESFSVVASGNRGTSVDAN